MVTPLDQRPRSGPYSGLNARSAKRFLSQAFREAGVPFADEDALEIILAATGFDRAALMLRGTEFLSPDVFETIQDHMARRLSGEPVDNILGWREFYGRRFQISRDVLSPRADTENLVRGALSRLDKAKEPTLVDLGTGSGAIGLTLLAERDDVRLVATDHSEAALSIAEQNAAALDVFARVRFAQGAWWDAIAAGSAFDMIVSNPPYITNEAMEALETEVVEFDPDLALRGGADGLDAYRTIISEAPNYLNIWTMITVDKDLSGLDRVVWAQKRP